MTNSVFFPLFEGETSNHLRDIIEWFSSPHIISLQILLLSNAMMQLCDHPTLLSPMTAKVWRAW